MKRFLILPILICLGFIHQSNAQGVVACCDDTLCAGYNLPIILSATVNGSSIPAIAGTTSYAGAAIPYNPDPFTGGTPVALSDDNWSGVIPLPFCFCYYGATYNNILVGSNNVITFDLTGAGGYCPWPISGPIPAPGPGTPVNAVLGPWEDLLPTAGGTISYNTFGVAPFRRFVVSWNQVAFYSCTGIHFTGQITLYESTNIIENHIQSKPDCPSWNGGYAIQGLQDATGANATPVAGRNFSVFTANNDGYRWTPNGVDSCHIAWYRLPDVVPFAFGDSITLVSTDPQYPIATTQYVAVLECLCTCGIGGITPDRDTVTITIDQPTIALGQSPATCAGNDGVAFVTMENSIAMPFTYNWSPSGGNMATASNLAAGPYTLNAFDALGCPAIANIVVTQTFTLVVAQGQTDVTCNGANNGIAWVTPNGLPPYGYTWTGSPSITGTASNLAPGNYTCTTTDANGCSTSNNFTILEPTAIVVGTLPTPASCFGTATGSITSNVVGGTGAYTYLWTPSGGAAANATNLTAGSYTVTVTDANNCTQTSIAVITEPTAVVATTSANVSICVGNNTNLTANANGGTGPYTYTWSDGQTGSPVTVSPAVTTTYSVTATDANGCTGVSPVMTVTVNPALQALGGPPSMICQGQSSTISASATGGNGNYNFMWSNGAGSGPGPITVTPNATTTYTVTVTDGCGSAPAQAPVTVTVNPLPVVLFTALPISGCPPLIVQFNDQSAVVGGNIVSWLWNFGDGNTSNIAAPTNTFYTSGSYDVTLTVTSNLGCSQTLTIPAMITVDPLPQARFNMSPSRTSVLDPKIHFTDKSTGATIVHYDFGDGSASNEPNTVHSYSATGTYIIEQVVENQFGCVDSTTQFVTIDPDVELFIPNAFTPDGDGHNDVFGPVALGITDYEMSIYDRWGQSIYQSKDVNLPWNGTVDGSQAKEDVYIYSITIKDLFAVSHKYVGKVSLIR